MYLPSHDTLALRYIVAQDCLNKAEKHSLEPAMRLIIDRQLI